MHSFSYLPLDVEKKEIRLLTLYPGAFDDNIQFTISHEPFDVDVRKLSEAHVAASLQDTLPAGWSAFETIAGRIIYNYMELESGLDYSSWEHPDSEVIFDKRNDLGGSSDVVIPAFEALSYTWGSLQSPETALHCDPDNQITEFSLGQNLACAFRHLRYMDRPRRLWVDAVCINQDDLEERSTQVLRMGPIYSRAQRVLAWIGPALEDSKFALGAIEQIGMQVELTRNGLRAPSPGITDKLWYEGRGTLPSRTWQSIYNIVELPWFYRLWIVQELQLANSESILICGNDTVPLHLFRSGMVCVLDSAPCSSVTLTKMQRIANICRDLTSQTLPDILVATRPQLCADPLDKLYGVLSLAPQAFATKIQPSYLASSVETYKTCFLAYLNQVQRLDLLKQCSISTRIPSAPSWIPNWSSTLINEDLHQTCTSGLACSHVAHHESGELSVLAVRSAKLRVVSEIITSESQSPGLVKDFMCKKFETELYNDEETLLDAYAWTFSFRRLRERHGFPGVLSLDNARSIIRAALGETLDSSISQQAQQGFWRQLFRRTKNHKFFVTVEGYIGFCNDASLPGDIICVILGCPMPMLLRPKSASTFEVVGECYVYGMMDTEILLGKIPSPWHFRVNHRTNNYEPEFWNHETQSMSGRDPRLGDLPEDWEVLDRPWTRDDPLLYAPHRNTRTGAIINWDPRMSPEALRARGVKLEEIVLV